MKNSLDIEIEALKKGDPIFIEELYAKYFEKLCTYSLNYISDHDLAQDIVQESLITLWTNRKKIVITTSLKSYLYKMVYYKIMDTHRKQKKINSNLFEYYQNAINLIIEADDDYKSQRLKKLDKCLSELPKRCKSVFIAKKITGMKREQVAIIFNISLKTVEGHITSANKYLKKCMKDTIP